MRQYESGINFAALARGEGRLTIEQPVEGGHKAPSRLLKRRLVTDGERTYTAYSADELLEIDSQAHHGRPGMLY